MRQMLDPILQMGKLRPREVMQNVQSHTSIQQLGQKENPALSRSQVQALSTVRVTLLSSAPFTPFHTARQGGPPQSLGLLA